MSVCVQAFLNAIAIVCRQAGTSDVRAALPFEILHCPKVDSEKLAAQDIHRSE
jgi:hypothetical protein